MLLLFYLGAVKSLELHPFKMLHEQGFRITLNTDDRLMSAVTLSSEYEVAHTLFGLNTEELYKISVNGIKSSFQSYAFKRKFIKEVMEPVYYALLAESSTWT